MAADPLVDAARAPEAARIAEIDIGRAARALAIVRWSDYLLVVVCGTMVLGILPQLALEAARGQWSDAVTSVPARLSVKRP